MVEYVSTTRGSTPHESVIERTVATSGDNPMSFAPGRNRAMALAVRPLRVQHRMAVAPTPTAEARPWLPSALLMVATMALDEAQLTWVVMSCVELSE